MKYNKPHFLLLSTALIFVVCTYVLSRQDSKLEEDDCAGGTVSEFPIMSQNIYGEAYRAVETIPADVGEGGIVNHHLLAAQYIAEVVESLKKANPDTVIIISPNHFNHGAGDIQVASLFYKTPIGDVKTDCGVVAKLIKANNVSQENLPMYSEHGILNILPFIAKSMPDAKVVPIIIKESASYADLDIVAKEIAEVHGAIVIGSFDFAHNLPPITEEFKDIKSIDSIQTFDIDRVKNINVDSAKGVYLTQKIMELREAKKFTMFRNTNSGNLTHQDTNDSTSYITGIYSKGDAKKAKVQTVQIFGDMMLDRAVSRRMVANGQDYPFRSTPNLFSGSDIVVANLEGVFSGNSSLSQLDSNILRFTFNPSFIPTLTQYHFDLLSQANNHSNDFGQDGADQSKELLLQNGISIFGDYFNQKDYLAIKEIAGKKIAFVGFNEFSYQNQDRVINLIKNARLQADRVIVMPHWGIEYAPSSNEHQQALAHAFIDAGADMVVGAHPHVVQDIEIYNGKAIIYSLGDFIFDQDFSKETTEGLSLGIVFKTGVTDIFLIPFDIDASQIRLKSAEARKTFLQELAEKSDTIIVSQILDGKITLHDK